MRSTLWCPGVDQVLGCLGPASGATLTFPPQTPALVGFRANRDSDGRGVFRQLSPGILTPEAVDQYALSETMLVVGYVTWSTSGRIHAFSLQAFVALGASLLEEALQMNVPQGATIAYLRCDYHPREAGKFCAEPPVHVHVRGKGAPRFSSLHSPNPVLGFLEFLATNFEHERWLEWARGIANLRGTQEAFEEVSNAHDQGRIYTEWEQFGPKFAVVRDQLKAAKTSAGAWAYEALSPSEAEYRLG